MQSGDGYDATSDGVHSLPRGTGAKPAEARALLDELAASYSDIVRLTRDLLCSLVSSGVVHVARPFVLLPAAVSAARDVAEPMMQLPWEYGAVVARRTRSRAPVVFL